jgi:Fe-S-cluster-containing hydrogenase component 2
MAEELEKSEGIDRRQFIIKAGAVVVVSAVASLAACVPTVKSSTKTEELNVPVSAVIGHDPQSCAGCGVCGLMCSLYHEGEQGPSLSRAEIVRDPFTATFTFNVCQQCRSPSCYFACPLKDSALCIDETTGVKYVNADKCDGCGKCVKACPLEPPRIKLHTEKKSAFNCDLCRGRDNGPICVEYCGMNALTRKISSEG